MLIDDVKRLELNLKSMPDWKGAVPDKIQGFLLKSFTAVHKVLATVLNECIEVASWLVGWRKDYSSDESLKEGYWSGELQTNCLPQFNMEASDRNHLQEKKTITRRTKMK